jgi:hypothetical protein
MVFDARRVAATRCEALPSTRSIRMIASFVETVRSSPDLDDHARKRRG